MYYHPTALIFISNILLLLNLRRDKLFKFIAIIYPILAILSTIYCEGIISIPIFTFDFIINFSFENKALSLTFIIILLSVNLYALGSQRKLDLVLGGFYCGSSIICLFAGDLVSVFVALELMMSASTILIFIGGTRSSERAARQYFLTHFFSGSIILVGISYIIAKTGSSEIKSLTEMIHYKDEAFFVYTLIFIGLLINVAAFPFSGWLINCYPTASSPGFVYLVSFTTKVSLMLMIKLFSGFEALKFFGIAMILYGGIYACIEDNLRRVSCYISLSHIGFMLVGISTGNRLVILLVQNGIILHVIYNALFCLSMATINIRDCSMMQKTYHPLLSISLCASIAMMINVPFFASFILKSEILLLNSESTLYEIMTLLNILIIMALPLKGYFSNSNRIDIKLSKYNELSLIVVMISLLLVHVFFAYYKDGFFAIILQNPTTILKQILVVSIGIGISWFLKRPRFCTRVVNFDLLHVIGNSFYHLYSRNRLAEDRKEGYDFRLISNILQKITQLHNQKVAIFIVFTLLILLILRLNRI